MGGMGGGHYTADCLNCDTQKWFNFNDSGVTLTDKNRLSSSGAYLLFYTRRKTNEKVFEKEEKEDREKERQESNNGGRTRAIDGKKEGAGMKKNKMLNAFPLLSPNPLDGSIVEERCI